MKSGKEGGSEMHGYDSTNGIIIGGDNSAGTMYDDGKKISLTLTAETDKKLTALARKWFKDHGGRFRWPNGLELRIQL